MPTENMLESLQRDLDEKRAALSAKMESAGVVALMDSVDVDSNDSETEEEKWKEADMTLYIETPQGCHTAHSYKLSQARACPSPTCPRTCRSRSSRT